ncbi:MAG: radical SAM protein [Lentisphaerota bacterium]
MSNKLQIVYEPKGAAKEYADLACNLYTSCIHGCRYCYVPGCVRKSREEFSFELSIVKDCVKKFEHDAKILAGDSREILFSFTSDHYQTFDSAALMERIYMIAEENNLRVSVLTKAGFRAVPHFKYFKRNGWKLGSTICFADEHNREFWEPGAPSIFSRIEAVKQAHAMGIYTWVSIEPVIYPRCAFEVIEELRGHVDLWKIGKINHMPELERKFKWVEFREYLKEVLAGENYYIKKSLTELYHGKVRS